jgi:UDP-glucuronate decarboxylase
VPPPQESSARQDRAGDHLGDLEPNTANAIRSTAARLAHLQSSIADHTMLISGGSGFLGSFFSDVAVLLGARVICVDNLLADSARNTQHLLAHPQFSFIENDIATVTIPDDVDYIAHMASIASPALYQAMPVQTMDSGLVGTRHVLEHALSHPLKGVLVTSTSEVYGDPPPEHIPTTEDYPGSVYSYGPRAMYDESKRAQEAYCYAYRVEANRRGIRLPIRIARIFNTYGPRLDADLPSHYGRAMVKFIKQALTHSPLTIYGDGRQTRSFCYVTDQIYGLFLLLCASGIDGDVFNMGNDTETSILDLVSAIKAITHSRSDIIIDARPQYNLQHDPQRRAPDLTQARTRLGYTPLVPLDDGLAMTVDWAKNELAGQLLHL